MKVDKIQGVGTYCLTEEDDFNNTFYLKKFLKPPLWYRATANLAKNNQRIIFKSKKIHPII